MTMTKADIVERIYEKVGFSKKEATEVVESIFELVKLRLERGEKVKISGFGNFGVKPYVLRYWESEFSVLRPGKTRSRHRLYRRKDVETLLEIRYLLYAERYTIEGAKRRLRDGTRAAGEKSARTEGATLAEVRQELLDLYRMLERDPAPPLKIE